MQSTCVSPYRLLSLEDIVELLVHIKPLLSPGSDDRLVQLCDHVIHMWFTQGDKHCHIVY